MTGKDKVHGEGNYAASRQYNQGAKKFAQSGKAERAARNAAPSNEREAIELEEAERLAKSRSKGEDPELYESVDDKETLDDETLEQDFDDDSDSANTRP